MLFLEFGIDDIIAIVTLVPIFILLIVATIIGVTKRIKMASKYKKNKNTVNEELKLILLEALGSEQNIEKIEYEMSRLTITVKDIDVVNPDVLKANGANGVLLVGNMVKCSFGEKAEEVCRLLQ